LGRLLGRDVDRHCVAVLTASDISAGCVARARPPRACAALPAPARDLARRGPRTGRISDKGGTQRALSHAVCLWGAKQQMVTKEDQPNCSEAVARIRRNWRTKTWGGSQEEEAATTWLWVPAGCGAVWFDSTGPRAPSFRLARPGASRHVCVTADA